MSKIFHTKTKILNVISQFFSFNNNTFEEMSELLKNGTNLSETIPEFRKQKFKILKVVPQLRKQKFKVLRKIFKFLQSNFMILMKAFGLQTRKNYHLKGTSESREQKINRSAIIYKFLNSKQYERSIENFINNLKGSFSIFFENLFPKKLVGYFYKNTREDYWEKYYFGNIFRCYKTQHQNILNLNNKNILKINKNMQKIKFKLLFNNEIFKRRLHEFFKSDKMYKINFLIIFMFYNFSFLFVVFLIFCFVMFLGINGISVLSNNSSVEIPLETICP